MQIMKSQNYDSVSDQILKLYIRIQISGIQILTSHAVQMKSFKKNHDIIAETGCYSCSTSKVQIQVEQFITNSRHAYCC